MYQRRKITKRKNYQMLKMIYVLEIQRFSAIPVSPQLPQCLRKSLLPLKRSLSLSEPIWVPCAAAIPLPLPIHPSRHPTPTRTSPPDVSSPSTAAMQRTSCKASQRKIYRHRPLQKASIPPSLMPRVGSYMMFSSIQRRTLRSTETLY